MQERKKPETLRLRSMMPSLTVDDLKTSIDWYCNVLGCILVDVFEQDGKKVGATVRAGTVELMLGQDDFAKGRDREKGVGFRFYCTTAQDVDQLAADIVARGGELAHGPTDQPWGARDFGVVDPDGFTFSISTAVDEGGEDGDEE